MADSLNDATPQVCPTHGCEMEWADCWNGCEDGETGSACIDDLCHGRERCIHGDTAMMRCDICKGRGGFLLCPECAPGAFYDA